MTIEELGQKVKAKYPEYAQMDDADIGKRVATKYPEYQAQIDVDKPQGVLGAVSSALGSRPELKAYSEGEGADISNPFIAARETLSAPIRLGATLARGPSATGEAIAETGGALGYPKTAAALGTAVSMAPELLGAGKALSLMRTSQAPLARAIRLKPKQLGQEFEAINREAGISGNLPERMGSKARFPPPELQGLATRPPKPLLLGETIPEVPPKSYPRDMNTFLNLASDRIKKFGKQLSPQELDDYKTELSTLLREKKGLKGTPPYAVATKLYKETTALQNEIMPGMEDLNKVYSLSKKLHPEVGKAVVGIVKKLWPHFRWGVIGVP